MRATTTLAILVLTASCGDMNARKSLPQEQDAPRSDGQAVSYRTVVASDGTFSVQLPVSWQLRNAQVRNTMAQGPRGESVAWGVISAIDVPNFQAYQRLLGQFAGYAAQVFPVVANPMPPEGVILYLYPRLYPGAQNIRILGDRPVGPTSSLVFYQYTPPASAGPMRGGALISAAPPQPGDFGIWTIAYWKAEAPASLFNRDMLMFGAILSSLHYNIDRILAMVAANQQATSRTIGNIIRDEAQEYQRRSQMITQNGQQMQAMQTQLGETFQTHDAIIGQNRIASLGGLAPFQDANGNPLYGPLGSKSVNTSRSSFPQFSSQDSSILGPGWRPITQLY
jgi:hypothetical protein